MRLREMFVVRPSGSEDRAAELAGEAEKAAQLRALSTHPDVIALRVERVRLQVDRLMWTGIVLGLAFTMANVQALAAIGQAPWSVPWLVAWLLDPMVSLVLVAVLRAEQVTSRWQVRTGTWVRAARWTALGATYVMNTWSAWAELDWRLMLLHSVPPLIVFVAAEAVTDLRERLTDAVHAAAADAAARHGSTAVERALSPHADRHAVLSPPDLAEDDPGTPARPPAVDAKCADSTDDRGGNSDVVDRSGLPDARVTELVDLLHADVPVTGEQAGVIFAVSDRTGRRLLAEARRAAASSGMESRADAPRTASDEETCRTATDETTSAEGPVVLRTLHREALEASA